MIGGIGTFSIGGAIPFFVDPADIRATMRIFALVHPTERQTIQAVSGKTQYLVAFDSREVEVLGFDHRSVYLTAYRSDSELGE